MILSIVEYLFVFIFFSLQWEAVKWIIKKWKE